MNNQKILIDFNTKEVHQAIERHLIEPGVYPGEIKSVSVVKTPNYDSREMEETILMKVLISNKEIPFFLNPVITAYGPSNLYKLLDTTSLVEVAKKLNDDDGLQTIQDLVDFLDANLNGYKGNFIVRTVNGEVKYSTIKEVVRVMGQ